MSDDASEDPKPRSWRWWVGAGVATAASAFALWMLLLNLALMTGFVPWVVSGEHRMSTVRIRYDSAWVVWPTRVHVEGFELDIDAYRYQLHLDIPEGKVDVALLDLVQRRFHARSIQGEGVSGVFRFKAPEGKVSAERLAAFGPIEGMPEPVRMEGQPDLPSQEKAWGVQLDRVDGQFVDLWINELHFVGTDANLRGGLRSKSGNFFEVNGAHLDGTADELHIGGEVIATDWTNALAVDVAGYDPFSLTGRAVLGQLTVDLDVQTKISSVVPAETFIPDSKSVALFDGAGELKLHVAVTDGVLGTPTAIEYRTDRVGAKVKGWHASAGAHVTLSVDSGTARAGADLAELRVRRAEGDSDGQPPIFAEKVEGFVATSNTDLAKGPFPLVDGRLRVPGLDVRDVAVFQGMSKSIEPRSGSATLSLVGNLVEADQLGFDVDGKLDNVVFAVKRSTVRTTVDFDLGARTSRDFSSGQVGEIDVHVGQLGVKSPNGHSNGAWVKVSGGSIRWDGKGVDASLRGSLDDLRPILSHVGDRKRLAELVPDLESTTPLDFDVGLEKRGEVLDISVDELARPLLSIRGFRRSRGSASRSAFMLTRARIGFTRGEDGDSDIDLAIGKDWLSKQTQWAKEL
ncbi:MAG: hypothetical protein ACE37F_02005 [Nannocystaceae bacterium]|nr:hypothetical protein [bacterium]